MISYSVSRLIIVVTYCVGIAGLLIPFTQPIFKAITPIHLGLIMFLLCQNFNKRSLLIITGIGLQGYLVEVLGVHTGFPFGQYYYNSTLGPHLFAVPPVIGINWIMLVVASVSVLSLVVKHRLLVSLLAATLMLGLDFLIEPVAISTGMWNWLGGAIPVSNYVAWFVVALLMTLQFSLGTPQRSTVGKWVLLMQLLFFTILNIAL